MASAYRQMLAAVPASRPPPTLEFYASLHGVGGLFMREHWVIAVGVADARDIAARLLRDHTAELGQIVSQHVRRAGLASATPFNVVLGAVVGRIIAHELGHALISAGFPHPFGQDEEAGADYIAAKLDAARGRDGRLGQLIFHSIGCTGWSCTHPSPIGRANAYASGFNEQLSTS